MPPFARLDLMFSRAQKMREPYTRNRALCRRQTDEELKADGRYFPYFP